MLSKEHDCLAGETKSKFKLDGEYTWQTKLVSYLYNFVLVLQKKQIGMKTANSFLINFLQIEYENSSILK